MKKTIFTLFCSCIFGSLSAQTTIMDTVTLGPQYANQVWYDLETGASTFIPKSDWDIAFKTAGMQSAAIFINDGAGTALWKYPGAVADWATLDTAGMDTWEQGYNSDTDWETGALNAILGAGQYDYGWGEYNMATHVVTGNAIFVIRLSNGDFKKLLIEDLTQGVYTFKYADLDNANAETVTLDNADYANKNFAYYSLQSGQVLDPEPDNAVWDLLFTQYTTQISMGAETVPYVVTGVLNNIGLEVAKVEHVDAAAYADYESHPLEESKNGIGYDWKSYDMNANAYVVADSTMFFLKDGGDNIWKLVFTGFGGSADGNFMLSKEKLQTTSIQDLNGEIASMAVYPNPAVNGKVTLAYSLSRMQPVQVAVFDYSGKCIMQAGLQAKEGMNLLDVSTRSWAKGLYFIELRAGGRSLTQKIVVH